MGSVNDRQCPGLERVTTCQQDWYIVLSHLRDRFRTSVETAQEIVGTHNNIWTQQRWHGVLFTDEYPFCVEMFDRRPKVWRQRGERFQDCCVKQVSGWGWW